MPETDPNSSLEEEKKVRKSGWKSTTGEVVRLLVIWIAISFVIRYFIAQPFIVRGASMEPNYQDQQYLVVDELSYYLRAPKRGEVIVFHYPRNTTQYFIKRIVGLPGETIKIENGTIHLINAEYPDGLVFEEPYLAQQSRITRPDSTIVLKNNEYFVLGDNRDFSSDSRAWGPLGKDYIVGKVLFRAWPPSKFGIVPNNSVEY